MKYIKSKFNEYVEKSGEIGVVKRVSDPIISVEGLPSVSISEVILFENGALGHVVDVEFDLVNVLLLTNDKVSVGEQATLVGNVLEVPVGERLLGKVINPLGKMLYEDVSISEGVEYRQVDRPAPGIEHRVKVTEPLETGVMVVDTMIPLGKGQRQLVIGDRKTGKTRFLLQTLLNQSKKGVVCIYVGIGKKKTDIKLVENFMVSNDIMSNCLIVASTSTDSPGTVYLTPYAARTMAEYFRDLGKDVLIILDDLTTHAKFYRELSLLGGNFPGRNAYPGDIFYTHGRLLERAGNFKNYADGSSVSITCLPVSDTIEGDISGYIQTNLMSMTDGHIYFDNDLFAKGRRPAVNYSLSVTRVGRQTQTPLRSSINRELTSFLSLHEKTQSFIHFGAELGQGVKTTLALGDKIIELFNQEPDKIMPIDLHIMLFSLVWIGTWNSLSTQAAMSECQKIVQTYEKSDEIRKIFADYVSKASDLNSLLGKLSSESTNLMTTIQNAAKTN